MQLSVGRQSILPNEASAQFSGLTFIKKEIVASLNEELLKKISKIKN